MPKDCNPTATKQYLGLILLTHELKYSPLLTPIGSSFPLRVHLSWLSMYQYLVAPYDPSSNPGGGQMCCRSHSSIRICTLLYQIIMKILDSASCLLHFGRHFLLNTRLGYAGDETWAQTTRKQCYFISYYDRFFSNRSWKFYTTIFPYLMNRIMLMTCLKR